MGRYSLCLKINFITNVFFGCPCKKMSHATDSDAQFEQNNVQIDTEASIATKEVTTFEGMLDVVGFGTFQFYLLQVCGLGWLVCGTNNYFTNF